MCRCQMWGVLQSWGIPVLSSWMTILGNLHNPRMILSMIFIGYKNLHDSHDIIHDIYYIRKPPFPWMTSMILSMIFISYISYISMGATMLLKGNKITHIHKNYSHNSGLQKRTSLGIMMQNNLQ